MAASRRTAPLLPPLGAGWHFPVAREQSVGGDSRRIAMASDELSVRQSIQLILSTAKGERAMRPEFGSNLGKLVFAPSNATTRALAAFEVREALEAWEPRIELLDVRVDAGGERGEQLLIDIAYRVRSTDNRFNLVFPFYLDRSTVS
jgi:phage baseplate assembly protein W